MGETILSNSSFLSDSKDDCEILVHFLSSNLGMLGSCQSHVFYTLEKEIQTKSQQRMKKTLPSCGFSENSLHLCTTQVSSHSYPFHPLQTQNWGKWREHLQCCSVHSELKVIWETLKMHFYLPLRQTKSQRHEELALNQSQSWAAGLLIPVPKSSLLKGFGAHKPSLEFKCSLKKNQTQVSAPSFWHSCKTTGKGRPWGCNKWGLCRKCHLFCALKQKETQQFPPKRKL